MGGRNRTAGVYSFHKLAIEQRARALLQKKVTLLARAKTTDRALITHDEKSPSYARGIIMRSNKGCSTDERDVITTLGVVAIARERVLWSRGDSVRVKKTIRFLRVLQPCF